MAVRKRKKTSIEWPTEVDDRVRLLVELAGKSPTLDGKSSASELLAALVCEQPLESGPLARTINQYRGVDMTEVARATDAKGGAPRPTRGRPRTGGAPSGGSGGHEL